MAWIPSWDLPAMRMMASEIFETFGAPPALGAATDESLMKTFYSNALGKFRGDDSTASRDKLCNIRLPSAFAVSISSRLSIGTRAFGINSLEERVTRWADSIEREI